MGKVFGILALIFGLVSIALLFLFWRIWGIVLPILAIVFGAIGIAKDDSKALGVVGLVLGIIVVVLWILAPIILVGLILGGIAGGGFF